jgi:hypothetical protein
MRLGVRLRCILLAVLCGIAFSTSDTGADARSGASLVAIVTPDPTAGVTHRIEEQLDALGFDVIVLNAPAAGSDGPIGLQQVARNVGAIAAIHVVPLTQAVDVWVADPVTGKEVSRSLTPQVGNAPSDAALALGAVELLRASLLELHPPEPPLAPLGPAPAPSCPPLSQAGERKPFSARAGFALGLGADFGAHGNPPLNADGAAWLDLYGRFGARFLASVTVLQQRVAAAQAGNIDVGTQFYGVEGSLDLNETSRRSVPVAGLGMGAVYVSAHGNPSATAVAAYPNTWAAVPFVHVGEGLTLVSTLRLRGDLLAGWSLERVRLCVDDTSSGTCGQVGQWGAPLLKVTVGIEALWGP